MKLLLLTLLPIVSCFYCETWLFGKQVDYQLFACKSNQTECAYLYDNEGLFSLSDAQKVASLSETYKAVVVYTNRDICCSASRLNFMVTAEAPVYIVNAHTFHEFQSTNNSISFDCVDTISNYHLSDEELLIVRIFLICSTVTFIVLLVIRLFHLKRSVLSVWIIYTMFLTLYRNTLMFIDPFFTTGLMPIEISLPLIFNIPSLTILQSMWIVLYYEELTRVKVRDLKWIQENRTLLIGITVTFFALNILCSFLYTSVFAGFVFLPVLVALADSIFASIVIIYVLARTLKIIQHKRSRSIQLLVFISMIVTWMALGYSVGLQSLIRNNTPASYLIKIGALVLIPSGCEVIIAYSGQIADRFSTSVSKPDSSKR